MINAPQQILKVQLGCKMQLLHLNMSQKHVFSNIHMQT